MTDNVKLFNNIILSSTRTDQQFYKSLNPGWFSIFKKRGAKNGEIICIDSLSLSKLFLDNYKIKENLI
jgi:hypothetical protein